MCVCVCRTLTHSSTHTLRHAHTNVRRESVNAMKVDTGKKLVDRKDCIDGSTINNEKMGSSIRMSGLAHKK